VAKDSTFPCRFSHGRPTTSPFGSTLLQWNL